MYNFNIIIVCIIDKEIALWNDKCFYNNKAKISEYKLRKNFKLLFSLIILLLIENLDILRYFSTSIVRNYFL